MTILLTRISSFTTYGPNWLWSVTRSIQYEGHFLRSSPQHQNNFGRNGDSSHQESKYLLLAALIVANPLTSCPSGNPLVWICELPLLIRQAIMITGSCYGEEIFLRGEVRINYIIARTNDGLKRSVVVEYINQHFLNILIIILISTPELF